MSAKSVIIPLKSGPIAMLILNAIANTLIAKPIPSFLSSFIIRARAAGVEIAPLSPPRAHSFQ